jgi:hypothetical protein
VPALPITVGARAAVPAAASAQPASAVPPAAAAVARHDTEPKRGTTSAEPQVQGTKNSFYIFCVFVCYKAGMVRIANLQLR